MRACVACWYLTVVWVGSAVAVAAEPPAPAGQRATAAGLPLELRAWGVPDFAGSDPASLADLAVVAAFQKLHPDIKPVSTTGLEFSSTVATSDVVPMMQIAGDIPPHVLAVNFRQSDTYIRKDFLYPLDPYVEREAGATIPDSHRLPLEEYLARLRRGAHYERQIAPRVPRQAWDVIRRPCPHGLNCPYVRQWGATPAAEHSHVWAWPQGVMVMALFYRKDLLAEAHLPDRAPATMDELYDWARKLTNPRQNRYGLGLFTDELSWGTLSFLYSCGGKIVEQDAAGRWRCCFDGEAAVEAYAYVARLFNAPFVNGGETFSSVVYAADRGMTDAKVAMFFEYLDQRFFTKYDPVMYGFGPVPAGPGGRHGAEFNADLTGIYAGLASDPRRRDAAWEYIRFYDSAEARRIRAKVFVENGAGAFVTPDLLEAAGYKELARQVPAGWTEARRRALESGIPEPYGKNCSFVYRYLSQAVDQIRTDPAVVAAVRGGDDAAAKGRIRDILRARVVASNERMLDILTPDQRRTRLITASVVAAVIAVVFVLMFRHVFRAFAAARRPERAGDPGAPGGAAAGPRGGAWQFARYRWAYLLMLPAVGSIALWEYWPLARGTAMAFQDYNVRGTGRWVGLENFANVLFDDQFWFALWVSLKYAALYLLFGFFTPIVLALLLTEVPRGSRLFRTVYYLPAVLSGVVVVFLWRGFYGPYGALNDLLNGAVHLLNHLPGVRLGEIHKAWLDDPQLALLFVLLPLIWAGMGPGCLIYLAALKTIPEEIYEAADIDGAGVGKKLRHVTFPSIKALVMINFIGVMIATIKSGGEYVLAMTGGGPYAPYGSTEVIGLHIYWQAFAYLRFGPATAMAWVLGSMLIGFTVMQLTRLSRMEFRAAGAK